MTIEETAALLQSKDNILILTHKRPDGDTIGCAAGLCAGLRQLGKTAWVQENPEATELFAPYLAPYLAPAEAAVEFVVTVDIADRSLFTDVSRPWTERGVDLAIDHHPSYEGFGRESCVNASRAACGEIIYEILHLLVPITAEIALPLYVAVSTDTGCFVYGNTNPHVHRVAAALMEAGIDYKSANKRHFRTKSYKRLRLESRIIDGMHRYQDGKVAIAAITLANMAQLQATEKDAEDIAAFLGQVEGVETSVTIRELTPGHCKLSVRTSGGLNASKVCALLGGGGHAAASGCETDGSVKDAETAILGAIETVQGS